MNIVPNYLKQGKNMDELETLTEKAINGTSKDKYQLGLYYKKKKDYKSAFVWCLKAAEGNNATAQNQVGIFYQLGQDVKQDYKKAVEWYKKAADQGFFLADLNLGLLYKDGKGVIQNHHSAYWHFKKAAEHNNTKAKYWLGDYYFYGRASVQDYNLAFSLLESAAKDGLKEAEAYLGYLYENGYGTNVSYADAYKWYKKAANKGYPYAQYMIGRLIYYHYRGSYEKEGIVWIKKAAEKKYKDAVNWVKWHNNTYLPNKKAKQAQPKQVNKPNKVTTTVKEIPVDQGPSKDRYFLFDNATISTTQEFLRWEYIGDIPKYAHVDIHAVITFYYKNCEGKTHVITEYTTVHDVFDTETYDEYNVRMDYPDRLKGFLVCKDYKSHFVIEKWL